MFHGEKNLVMNSEKSGFRGMVGKTPSQRERFMMLVIGVRRTSRHSLVVRTSRHSLMVEVRQGSKSHDFVADLDMSFLKSSSVNDWKETSEGGV